MHPVFLVGFFTTAETSEIKDDIHCFMRGWDQIEKRKKVSTQTTIHENPRQKIATTDKLAFSHVNNFLMQVMDGGQ